MPNAGIYCPGVDEEMQENLNQMVSCGWADANHVYKGGQGGLNSLDPMWKLYILCHGHKYLPVFSTEAGKWSAEELADLIVKDGLKNTHRTIELLVCHAGASVTTKKAAIERTAIAQKAKAAKTAGNDAKFEKLKDKFLKVSAKGPQPANFTHQDQVLPLCAQFVQELKTRRFEFIRVIGYALPVCMLFAEAPGKVRLDASARGGSYGAGDEHTMKQYTVTWL